MLYIAVLRRLLCGSCGAPVTEYNILARVNVFSGFRSIPDETRSVYVVIVQTLGNR